MQQPAQKPLRGVIFFFFSAEYYVFDVDAIGRALLKGQLKVVLFYCCCYWPASFGQRERGREGKS